MRSLWWAHHSSSPACDWAALHTALIAWPNVTVSPFLRRMVTSLEACQGCLKRLEDQARTTTAMEIIQDAVRQLQAARLSIPEDITLVLMLRSQLRSLLTTEYNFRARQRPPLDVRVLLALTREHITIATPPTYTGHWENAAPSDPRCQVSLWAALFGACGKTTPLRLGTSWPELGLQGAVSPPTPWILQWTHPWTFIHA